MSYPRYEIYRDAKLEFRFRLKAAGNYEIILHSSEGYKTKAACDHAVGICQENSPFEQYYNRLTAGNGQYYFTLRAKNGEPIGMSEMYNSFNAREGGISAVKRDGPTKSVVYLP
jgi:uncharacterized protein YegP (UPF0339 family)